jgi:hypothetical protein
MNEAYIFTLIACHMSRRRTKTYSTHSAYVTWYEDHCKKRRKIKYKPEAPGSL